MRPYNHSLNNIELYTLDGIDLISLIKDYKGKALYLNDKVWLTLSSRGGRDNNIIENMGKVYLIFTVILEMDLFRLNGQSQE